MRKRPNTTEDTSQKDKSTVQDKAKPVSANDDIPTVSWKKLILVVSVGVTLIGSLYFFTQWRAHVEGMALYEAEQRRLASLIPKVEPSSVEGHELGKAGGVVVVVGGGLAGLSAASAVALSDSDVKVVLVDKSKVNGNSVKATSGINAVLTRWQVADAEGAQDSIEAFVDDILKSGRGMSNANIARSLAARSSDALEFLADCGVEFSGVERLGGHKYPRTHRIVSTPAVGWKIVSAVKQRLINTNRIKILEDARVTDFKIKRLPTGEPVVTAVEYIKGTESHMLPVDAVVLAAGGFAADRTKNGVMSQYGDDYRKYSTTNGSFSTGDMMNLALMHDIQTLHLNQIQLHPTAFVDPASPAKLEKFCCPEIFRGTGAVLINKSGARFVDELSTRDAVANASLSNGFESSEWPPLLTATEEPRADLINALVFNGKTRTRIGEATVAFYESKNFIKKIGDVKATAAYLGVPVEELQSTLEKYEVSALNAEDQFGKTIFPETITANDTDLHVAFVTPATHYTMGGIRVNTDGQVCFEFAADDPDSDVCEVPAINLFAAGEVAGGLHGGNRLGGNGLLESVALGRHAGHRAALAANTIKQAAPSTAVDALGAFSLATYTQLEVRDVLSFNDASRSTDTIRLVRFNLPSPFSQMQFRPGRMLEVIVVENGKKYGLGSMILPPLSLTGIHRGFVDMLIAKPSHVTDKVNILWSTKSGDKFMVRETVSPPAWVRTVDEYIVENRVPAAEAATAGTNGDTEMNQEADGSLSGDKVLSGHKIRVFVKDLSGLPAAMQLVYIVFPQRNQAKVEVHCGGPSASMMCEAIRQQTIDAYYPNSGSALRSAAPFETVEHYTFAAMQTVIDDGSVQPGGKVIDVVM